MTVHLRVSPALPPIRSADLPSLLRPNPNSYSFGEVCQQLGILFTASGRLNSTAWKLGYVMTLIQDPRWQFPEPFPAYNHKAGKHVGGAASVGVSSQWLKGAVDIWFERFNPPGSPGTAAIEQDLDGGALDANAGNLAAMLRSRKVRA